MEQTFNDLMGQLEYSMLIVTALANGERDGCLVGFATQCSIDPPRFLVCLSAQNRTSRIARSSDALLVHLPSIAMDELVGLFGGETGDEIDKFSRCAWHAGPRGLPVLDECPRWFAGEIVARHALGDHTGFVLEPFAAENAGDGAPFPFQRAKHLPPGHEP